MQPNEQKPMDLEGRTRVSGDLVRKGDTQSSTEIQPVHNFRLGREIIPIDWTTYAHRQNDNLEAAARAIIEDLERKYGSAPENYRDLISTAPYYTARLKAPQGKIELGPAHVFTWIRRSPNSVPILEREPILGPDGKRMGEESLQITIFEHPQQKGLFLYQVVHSGGTQQTLFDAGYYHQPEQRVVSVKELPTQPRRALPYQSGMVKK